MMCLAVPTKIISIDGQMAEVDIGGVGARISIALTPTVKVGDYVLVHTGFAIEVLDEAEALETLQMLREMQDSAQQASGCSTAGQR